jgi:glycosyltransferase involved in cell wall biosynthesis
VNKAITNVRYIRTYYPHWGERSGIHQFIQYLAADKYQVQQAIVPMEFPGRIGKKLDSLFARSLKGRGAKAYRLNDAREEAATLFQAITKGLDIVHYLDGEHGIMFLPGVLRKLKRIRPMPISIGMFHQPAHILEGLLNPKIISQLDYVTVVSPEQADYISQYVPREKIRVILHGIDTDHFRPPGHKPPAETLRCLAGGVWLRDYKAVLETARLLRKDPGIEFHLIASNLEKPADLGNVFIHRNIPDEKYRQLFEESNVLFMPLEAATANNVILEGIACGLPIVSSELPSVKAYLPGDEALLVKDNDPRIFADILRDLLRHPEKRVQMSRQARQRAEELSWPNIAKQYDTFYTEILESRRNSR